ncbi:hypothetical protein D3C71_1701560 [compost metagenome]
MQRTTGRAPTQLCRLAQVMPAAIETINWPSCRLGCRAWQTAFMTCGFTARTITSASAMAWALSSKVSMPCSAWMRLRVSAPGSLARICEASRPWARRPPIRLAAMLPAPMKAIRVLLMSGPCGKE